MLAIFAFTNEDKGTILSRTCKKNFKGVQLLIFQGRQGNWLLFRFNKHGITLKTIYENNRILSNVWDKAPWIKSFLVAHIDCPVSHNWKPFIVQSCNEVCRYLSGVDIGFTINPFHLYKKLLKYDGRRNYTLLRRIAANGKIWERPRPQPRAK